MKRSLTLVLLLLFVVVAFCGCGDGETVKGDGVNNPSTNPYQSGYLPNVSTKTCRVYVCGAVQTEGYYDVKQGTIIADVIALAGILPQSVLPQNSESFAQDGTQIVVGYYQNQTNYDCINLNGAYVTIANMHAENVNDDILAKLHDYYTKHGVITNKNVLKRILSQEEYQLNHYKFFVQEKDYATAD